MKLQILTVAILSALLAGCGSSSSSAPADDSPTDQPSNDGSDNSNTDDSDTDNSDSDDSGTDTPNTDDSGTDTSDTDDSGTDNPPTNETGNSGFSSIQGNVQLVGFVDIDDQSISATTDATAGFIRFDSALTAPTLQDSLEDELLDQCDISVSGILDGDDSLEDLDLGFPFTTVSAGETISLSSAAGTYGELQRGTVFGFTAYGSDVDLVYPAPSPLTINIPGDVFPAFSNVAVSAPPPVSGFNVGAIDNFNAETEFSWEAVNTGDTTISINFSQFNINTFQFVSVDCTVTDNGSFSFPASTVAELNDNLGAGWSATGISVSRETLLVEQQGSAVLVVTRTSD